MPAKPLSAIAAELVHAPDAAAALAILHEELAAADRNSGFALLTFDARRDALVNRAVAGAEAQAGDVSYEVLADVSAPPGYAHVAIDHLPPAVHHLILDGLRFADIGDQAAQYARLLGVELPGTELRLLLKGIVVEGALVAVIAAYDSRRRSATKLLERAEPLGGLFEMAYVRLYEREGRFEAVAALHDVTSKLRAEHASAIAALEREVERLRVAQRAGTSDVVRQLRDAVGVADRRATTAEQRLMAVEGQVVSAVDRLERVHLQLADQDATIRTQRETIRELEQQIATGNANPVRS